MKTRDLIPRAQRRMRQPRKDLLREQLPLAATTIEQNRTEVERLIAHWWRRIWRKATTLALLALLLTACGQPACDPHPGYRPDGQQCD